MEDKDRDDNDGKGISALELDRVLGFLWGHQGHWPLYDDDNEEEYGEEEYDKVEDNEVEDNEEEDNDDKRYHSSMTR